MRKISTLVVLLTAMLSLPLQAADKGRETAILAGGCFWCMEADFEKLPGVVDVVSGYTGGKLVDPSYEGVSSGRTGHLESVEVTFDAKKISYSGILDYYWRHIDPTHDDGQFCDTGPQYRPAIFYQGAAQKAIAEKSKAEIEKTKPFPDPIKVELLPASTFYPAEQYHQDYYKKSPIKYRFYRYSCGRDKRVAELWGDS